MKVAFLTSHPIQYQVPVFRHLEQSDDCEFTAVFCMLPDAKQQGAEFGVEFEWDIPLLNGYQHHVLENVSENPGMMHFGGCDTPSVRRYFQQQQFDVVAINGWVVKSCLQAARACRSLGIPCIVRGEANNLRPRPWWKRFVHKRLMRFYDAFCPIGTASAAFYQELGIPNELLFRSPYCIENARIESTSPRDDASIRKAREHFGISPDACCFLFCGKLIDKKQPLGLLEALRHCIETLGGKTKLKSRSSEHHPHVLMVGDGELRAQCERLCKEHELPVTFAGFLNQSEIGMAYSASDSLVLPSNHGETWGLVVNEAFAAGIPALVSDQVGCHPDLIEPDHTGWVHAYGDWEQLGAQMATCTQQKSRLVEMGAKAKKLIEEYSPQVAAKGLLAAASYLHQGRSTR